MLSSVLRSARAVRVNIAVMRAFVALRREAALHGDLVRRLDELPDDGRERIGFHRETEIPPPRRQARAGRRGAG